MIPDSLVEELLDGNEWWHKLARRCTEKGQYRVIFDREESDPYMIRFYLHPRWMTLGLFRVVLHRFIRSDSPDDGLHDHPWPYISIPISVGYYEWLRAKPVAAKCAIRRVYRRRLWPIFSRARKMHRIELAADLIPCWTLFIMGPKIRKWGFHIPTPYGWSFYPWRSWIEKRTTKKDYSL